MYVLHSARKKRCILDSIAIQAARTEVPRVADHEQLALIDLSFANYAPSSLQTSVYLYALANC